MSYFCFWLVNATHPCFWLVRLPALVGVSRALDLILTGRLLEPREALDWGLANRVVTTGTAFGQAMNLAKEIVKFPQVNSDNLLCRAWHDQCPGMFESWQTVDTVLQLQLHQSRGCHELRDWTVCQGAHHWGYCRGKEVRSRDGETRQVQCESGMMLILLSDWSV